MKKASTAKRAKPATPASAVAPATPPGVLSLDKARRNYARATLMREAAGVMKSKVHAKIVAKKKWMLPKPPPGVVPEGATLALDEAGWEANIQGWAVENSMFDEGLMFLGYPYLAELSQRPEYRRISETIAKEMTRKWIKITSTGDDQNNDKAEKIKIIEAEFKRLKVQSSFRRAAELDGFFGRSHIYIDLGTDLSAGGPGADELKTPLGNGSNRLTKAKVKKGSLKRLAIIEPVWTYPNAYNASDPLRTDYFKPTSWFVQGREIHSSRLLTFVGREMPDLLKPAYSFGGLALSQMAKPYVDNWLRTRQSVSDAVSNFSIMMMMTDLSDILEGGGAETMIARAELFNAARDNRGLMMANKETEDLKNVSMPLGGLDHLQAQSQEHQSSVTGIPMVKLLGITPSGLNASSDEDLQCWYDWILAYQEGLFTDPLTKILNIVQLSKFGEIDPDIGFKYELLHSKDDSTDATTRKTKADTAGVLIDHGVISPQEERERLAREEDSDYSNLDLSVAPPEPPGGEAEPGQEPGMTGEDPPAASPGAEADTGNTVHPGATAKAPAIASTPVPSAPVPSAPVPSAPVPTGAADAVVIGANPNPSANGQFGTAANSSRLANHFSTIAVSPDSHNAAAMLHDAASTHYSKESHEFHFHKNTAVEHRKRAYELEHPLAPIGGGVMPDGSNTFPPTSEITIASDEFNETDHPRGPDGQFGEGDTTHSHETIGWTKAPWDYSKYKDAPDLRREIVSVNDAKEIRKKLKASGRLNDDNTVSLYHVTLKDPETLKGIRDRGLVPGAQQAPGQNWKAEHSSHSTYFHSSKEVAERDVEQSDGTAVIVEARIPITPKNLIRFLPDEDSSRDPKQGVNELLKGGAVAFIGGVPNSSIKVHDKTNTQAHDAKPGDAAGVILVSKEGKVLFLLRGPDSDNHPNTWCFPAGRAEPGEDLMATAIRECEEETGWRFQFGTLINLLDNQPHFATFVIRGVDEFTPHDRTEEHQRYVWALPADAPQPLHPGCGESLQLL